MGPRQDALFYVFSTVDHVPRDDILRAIDRFVDRSGVQRHLAPAYSLNGRPYFDPELMIRMLLVGYAIGIRSERRLCEEGHLNHAYRFFSPRSDRPGAGAFDLYKEPARSVRR